MFFLDSHTSCCLNQQQQSFQCRLLQSPPPPPPPPPTPPPLPALNTGPTTFVLGTITNKTPNHIFIPSSITTRHVKNTPTSMINMSWSFVTMSPRSLDGICARVGLLRTAPTTMGMWMSAPERNTLYMAKTRSSMISVSKQVRRTTAPVK